MKALGATAEQLAFRLAIDRALEGLGSPERGREAAGRPQEREAPQKAPSATQRGAQAAQRLAEGVESLANARARQQAAQAEEFEKLARRAGMPPEAAAHFASNLRSPSTNEWTFVMISPAQNSAVVRWISENSKRPQAATLLWAHLFEVMRNDTGEILRSREELAERLGISAQNLSRIITELCSINAIRREKQGREVRYFMNANIATHLPGHAARKQAREEAGPLLVMMEGGAR